MLKCAGIGLHSCPLPSVAGAQGSCTLHGGSVVTCRNFLRPSTKACRKNTRAAPALCTVASGMADTLALVSSKTCRNPLQSLQARAGKGKLYARDMLDTTRAAKSRDGKGLHEDGGRYPMLKRAQGQTLSRLFDFSPVNCRSRCGCLQNLYGVAGKKARRH